MKSLLWKEFHLNASILIMGLILLVAPYLVVSIVFLRSGFNSDLSAVTFWSIVLETSSYFSIFCAQFTISILGAYIIACERADRSAEFLAYLPPSREEILLAKGLLIAGFASIAWLINLLIMTVARSLRDEPLSFINDLPYLSTIAVHGLLWSGVGWLMSSFSRAPAHAIILAFPSPIIVFFLLTTFSYLVGAPSDMYSFSRWYNISCFVVAQISFAAGAIYYIHRVDP
jgi:hypothetical protein